MNAGPAIAARIRREGPIPFDVFMELALYGDGGFFTSGRGAGRAGRDFVTSPEVGALFGACVARALDRGWEALDRPDPFLVVEAGAGTGRLARDVLRAAPACAPALRYVLVERSPALRAQQRDRLRLEPADEALGPFGAQRGDDRPIPEPGTGPVCTSLPDLPAITFDGIVFGNELLDNLPFGIAEWRAGAWHEVRVTVEGGGFAEVVVPAPDLSPGIDGDLAEGARVPVPSGMRAWLYDCARIVHRGFVVLVDYLDAAAGVARRGRDGWLRTYRSHERGTDPLHDPGTQDITADIVTEQLAHAAQAAGFAVASVTTQAEWLRDLGIDELTAQGRATWEQGAARGDLAALAGRSRVNEAAALTDPAGLGAHRVVVLSKGAAR